MNAMAIKDPKKYYNDWERQRDNNALAAHQDHVHTFIQRRAEMVTTLGDHRKRLVGEAAARLRRPGLRKAWTKWRLVQKAIRIKKRKTYGIAQEEKAGADEAIKRLLPMVPGAITEATASSSGVNVDAGEGEGDVLEQHAADHEDLLNELHVAQDVYEDRALAYEAMEKELNKTVDVRKF